MIPYRLVPLLLLTAAACTGLRSSVASQASECALRTARLATQTGAEAQDDQAVTQPTSSRQRLADVRSWAIQLQGLEQPGATQRLLQAPVDMFVLETTDTVRGSQGFPIEELVERLHARPRPGGRSTLCLAYLNVGQAEDYRTYWSDAWRTPPGADGKRQGFVLCEDPEGWTGNFPVAYWDPAWRSVLFGSARALVDRILDQGFDGVYLDWVLGFVDETVAATAKREGVDPALAMAELIRDLRAYARERRPGFLVIAQNPGDLIERVPAFTGWIDGISQEGLTFAGAATSVWDAPESTGRRRAETGEASVAAFARLLGAYAKRGLPVFTVDYARERAHIDTARRTSRDHGFVPFVTRTPLDRLPDHVFELAPGAR